MIRFSRRVAVVAALLVGVCVALPAQALQGRVLSGTQPIVGSTVLVYAAGLNPGDGPRQIAAAASGADGGWQANTLNPSPAPGQFVYAVALGGHVGNQPNNANISLMSYAGAWGAPEFHSTLLLNELSTVATTAQFQDYLSLVRCDGIAGSTTKGNTQLPLNCPSLARVVGQESHMPTLANLVDVETGSATRFLTLADAKSALYGTLTRLNLQASVMAQCVRGGGQACTNYFSVAGLWSSLVPSPVTLPGSPFKSCWQPGAGDVVMAPNGASLYVLDQTTPTSSIRRCSIDPVSGALTPLGNYTLVNGSAGAMAMDPQGRFLYVTINNGNQNAGTVQTFRVDPVSGELSTLGQPTATVPQARSIAITPDGRHVYVGSLKVDMVNPGNGGMTQAFSKISVLDVGAQGGLIPNAKAVVQGPLAMYGLTVDRSGKYLYALGSNNNAVQTYAIDAQGALSSAGYVATGNAPYALVTTPDGRYAYVSNLADNTVSIYALNQGVLTPVQSRSFTNPVPVGGGFPQTMVVAPDGRSLYVLSSEQNYRNTQGGVAAFTIDVATGALTPLLKNLLAPGHIMNGMAMTPDGRFVYASSHVDDFMYGLRTGAAATDTLSAALNLAAYPVASSGAALFGLLPTLPAQAYTPIPAAAPAALVVGGKPYAYLFSANSNKSTVNTIDPVSGTLSPVPGTTFDFGFKANYQALTPDGRFIYAWDSANQKMHGYSVAPGTGLLSDIGAWPIAPFDGETSAALMMSPDGRFLYVATGKDGNAAKTLKVYSIDADSGALSGPRAAFTAPLSYQGVTPPPVGGRTADGPAYVTFAPDGRAYCVSGFFTFACAVDAKTGALTTTTPEMVVGLIPVFTPFNLFTYVYDTQNQFINIYQEQADGVLAQTGARGIYAVIGDNKATVTVVEFSPNGRFGYLLAQTGKRVGAYQVNSKDGSFQPLGDPLTTLNQPQFITFTADGRFGYEAHGNNEALTVYGVDANTGALTDLKPAVVPASSRPVLMVP